MMRSAAAVQPAGSRHAAMGLSRARLETRGGTSRSTLEPPTRRRGRTVTNGPRCQATSAPSRAAAPSPAPSPQQASHSPPHSVLVRTQSVARAGHPRLSRHWGERCACSMRPPWPRCSWQLVSGGAALMRYCGSAARALGTPRSRDTLNDGKQRARSAHKPSTRRQRSASRAACCPEPLPLLPPHTARPPLPATCNTWPLTTGARVHPGPAGAVVGARRQPGRAANGRDGARGAWQAREPQYLCSHGRQGKTTVCARATDVP